VHPPRFTGNLGNWIAFVGEDVFVVDEIDRLTPDQDGAVWSSGFVVLKPQGLEAEVAFFRIASVSIATNPSYIRDLSTFSLSC
jgi:hypothetical protein